MKIYVSHSIRGKFNVNATDEQMEENNRIARNFGKLLKLNFPEIDWYIPADHDEFVKIAYLKGCMKEKQILDVDCEIISKCQGLLVFQPDGYISRGMEIEIEYAKENNYPIVDIKNQDWKSIREFLETIK